MTTADEGRCKPPFRYPGRVRDLALEVWGFRCGRDFACSEREVRALGVAEGWPCLPTADTLRQWAAREDWDGAIAERLRQIAPGMAERAVTDLILAACEGAAFMRDVMSGKVPNPRGIQARIAVASVQALGLDHLARQEFAGLISGQGSLPALRPGQGAQALGPGQDTGGDEARKAVLARLLSSEHGKAAE